MSVEERRGQDVGERVARRAAPAGTSSGTRRRAGSRARSTPQSEPAAAAAVADPVDLVAVPARTRFWQEWPFLLVTGTAAAGLAVVASDHFKRGTVLFGLALVLATVLRAVLPDQRAGLLRVRRRSIDLLCLATLAAGTLVLAIVVPPPT